MASTLIAIKSELLLPQSKVDDDEISPKARLIRRLEEYAQIKEAARRIDGLLRLERDVFSIYQYAKSRSHAKAAAQVFARAFGRKLNSYENSP